MKAVVDAALADVPSVAARRSWCVAPDSPALPGCGTRPSGGTTWLPAQPTKPLPSITAAEDVLMVIYTSGTTGKPKGAVHTHCGFPDQGRAGHAPLAWTSSRRDDALLDDRHGLDDGAVGGLWRAAERRDHALLRRRARLSRTSAASGRWSSATASRTWACRPRSIRSPQATATAPFARTISRACAWSAPPAAPGTPSRGSGSSTPCSAVRNRSSTTPAARKSAAASCAATCSRRSSPAPSAGLSSAWMPTSSTKTGNPGARCRGRTGPAPALDRHDARLLARP